MNEILEIIMNTDEAILGLIRDYGTLTYLILFLIIFSETGLVVCPFFPGDGLLLSVGVIASTGALDIFILTPVLILAAILGNLTNYIIGKYTGERIIRVKNKTFHKYLNQTHLFFEKHGSKAVMISRFFPIVRTYVPFVAGITSMKFSVFNKYNILGGTLWVLIFTTGGCFAAEIPWVKANFGLIFGFIMFLTVIPFLYGLIRSLLQRRVTT